MKQHRRVTRAIVVGALIVVAAALAPSGSATAASCRDTGDRPVCVAKVQLDNTILLQPDGSLTVAAHLSCDPGWIAGDLSVIITQGGAETSAFLSTSIACDGHRYTVQLDAPVALGSFMPGKAQVNGQFLVTNADSGDSAAGHDQTTCRVRAA